MTTIAEFIEARLADTEQRAIAATNVYGPDWKAHTGSEYLPARVYGKAGRDRPVADVSRGSPALHIAMHDPARVLREVAAMRAILREHQAVARLASLTGQELGFLGWYREWILRNLAAIWSDHPDFPPEWAPEAAEAR